MRYFRRRENPHPGRNRGAALLVLLLAAALAFGAVLAASLAGTRPEIERQKRTREALAQAKQALIAWAAVQGDAQAATKMDDGVRKFTYRRPGTLPCPDRNHFGKADSGNASGSCSSAGGTSIGRLPWKSLGMDRLRDGHGESLWYAVSDNFRSNVSNNYAAINSDTKGMLLLYAADGNTLMTPAGEELAAVIFAPGPPLPGQDRKTQSDEADSLVPSDYLEAFNGKNNANAAGPFIMGPVRNAAGNLIVNDLAIGLTARELISGMERRALNEAQNALKKYADEHGRYPNPAPFHASGCLSGIADVRSGIAPCAADAATPACYGRLPEDVFAPEGVFPQALFPYAAPWFLQNGWGRAMIYAINDSAAGCATALKLDGQPRSYVLIAPGAARAGQTRPSASPADYLEGANANTGPGNLDFAVPGADAGNDQLRAE